LKRVLLFIFILLGLVELCTHLFRWPEIHRVVKPLLMPSLLLWYYFAAGADRRCGLVVAALIFSWGGDVLLMFQREARFFMFGLASFLIAHVAYIFSYRRARHGSADSADPLDNVRKLRMAFPVLLAGVGLVAVLYPTLENFRFPVTVYALVIQVMVINAVFRYGRTTPLSFWAVLSGALLFMISDSLIAVNKFYAPLAGAGFWIMVTYLAGQFLIVRGLLAHR
jgi:uncharacterized membrane protein YhhN